MNKKSVSMVEVIVGAVILALVFGSLLAAFTTVREYVLRANKRLVSSRLIGSASSDLHVYVRDDTWANAANPLFAGDHGIDDTGLPAALQMGPYLYTGNYTSLNLNTSNAMPSEVRRVSFELFYPD